jgi:hypothetical protein
MKRFTRKCTQRPAMSCSSHQQHLKTNPTQCWSLTKNFNNPGHKPQYVNTRMQKQSRQSALTQCIKTKQKLTSEVALTTTVVERSPTPNCFSENFPQTPCEQTAITTLLVSENRVLNTTKRINTKNNDSKPNQRFEIKITFGTNKEFRTESMIENFGDFRIEHEKTDGNRI